MHVRRFSLALFFSVMMTAGPDRARAEGIRSVPHQVLAFYYGWYTPLYGNGDWTLGVRWTPSAGPYDSWNQATTDRQAGEASDAGITGFIASWWPQRGAYTDRQLPVLLRSAQAAGLTVSALIEDIQGAGSGRTASQIVSDIEYVLTTYGGHPAWLKVNGRPVVFLYTRVVAYLPDATAWNDVLATVRRDIPGAIILGDLAPGYRQDTRNTANWDGLFSYTFTRATQNRSLPDIEARQIKACRALATLVPPGDLFTLTIGPGYDDSETNRPAPRPIVQRYDGGTFRAMFRAAIPANPDWILISTYNEWTEGTQIEPSVQFGTSALDDTVSLSGQFLAQRPRGG